MGTNSKNKHTILVIEDEKPILATITEALKLEGFGVKTVQTAKDAYAYLRKGGNPSLIWLDHYLLGDETGLDFLVAIKKNEKWKDIPVFVVSNTASAEIMNEYFEVGIAKYHAKTISKLEEIIKDMKKYLNTKQ